jgi:biotin operon repressor
MPEADFSPLFTWRSAICESGLRPVARHVALTLSLHMNERGASCFPSIATLHRETGLSERAVQEALKTLRDEGWILVKQGGSLAGGRRVANTYRAMFPASYLEAREADITPVQEVHRSDGAPVQVVPLTGAAGAPQDVKRATNTGRAHARTADGLDLEPVYRWLEVLGVEYAEDRVAFMAELAERFGIGAGSELAEQLHTEALTKAERKAGTEGAAA